MGFRSEVKVWSDGVFKELNEQVSGQKQCHGADNCFRRSPAGEIRSPNANRFRQYLKKNCSQHKARAECDQILQKAFAKAVRARLDKQKSADKVRGCGQQAKDEKSDKSPGIKIHCLGLERARFFQNGRPIYINPVTSGYGARLDAPKEH